MFLTTNFYYNLQQNSYKPHFQGKTSTISTEKLTSLIESGKTVKQIKSELGIALDTFYKLLRERGIEYKKKGISENIKSITKAQIETLLNAGKTVAEICAKLNIKSHQYYRLLESFGIKSPHKIKIERASAITKTDLEDCIRSFSTVKERCANLGITKDIYFRLVQQYEIDTPYKNQVRYNSSICPEEVIELIKEGKSAQEIIKILGISETFYNKILRKNNIVTSSKSSKLKISEITKERLENLIAQGKKIKEICEELNINESTYTRLLNRFEIITQRKKDRINVSQIKKEDIQILINKNFSPDEICKNLNISRTTFYELLKFFNINYDYLHHAKEIPISKSVLEESAKSKKTVKEISKSLGIHSTTYNSKTRVNRIKTTNRDSITRIASISKEELQQAINEGLTVAGICKKFKITPSNYKSLAEKYNIRINKRITKN